MGVYKRGKTWYISYRNPKKRKIVRRAVSWARCEADAKKEYRKARSDVQKSKMRAAWGAPDSDLTLAQVLDRFIAYGKKHKRSWRDDQLRIAPIKEQIGAMKAMDVSPDTIEQYLAWKREHNLRGKQGGKVEVGTLNRHLAVIRSAYSLAVRDGLLIDNPARKVRPFKGEKRRERTLAEQEYQRILEQVIPHARPLVVIGWETPMRRREIEHLRWAQVDFQARVIRLTGEDTKTATGRAVPLSKAAYECLSRIKKEQVEQTNVNLKSAPYVFRWRDRTGVWRHFAEGIHRSFSSACRRAGVKGVVFHTLRHTWITRAVSSGMPWAVVMAITGHKSAATMLRYTHVSETDSRAAMGRFEEIGRTKGSTEVNGDSQESLQVLDSMVGRARFERAANGLKVRCST